MDIRRRAGHGRQPLGRPMSATRRRACEGQGLLLPKDRRPPHPSEAFGLARQASAPSLGNNNQAGLDSFSRGGSPSEGGYGGLGNSPMLRRTMSATCMGNRGGIPRPSFGHGGRRYESPSRYGTPDRGPDSFVSRGVTGSQPRVDALQLESRLKERLREHSLLSHEGTRPPTADMHHRAPMWPSSPFNRGRRYDERFAGRSPYADQHGAPHPSFDESWCGGQPCPDRHNSSMSMMSSHHMGDSHYGHSGYHGASQDHFVDGPCPQSMGLDDTSMPESRFKVYSDLFEEVIERDRVFGSLLRKIKNSYDFMVMNGMQPQGMPPLPQEATPPHNRSAVDVMAHVMVIQGTAMAWLIPMSQLPGQMMACSLGRCSAKTIF